ncbi:MAG: hypothetical protein KDI53_02660, partial [Candidatus Accumulibacter sp.]|nr:hypothetical protein [Accumulibacter sp.]
RLFDPYGRQVFGPYNLNDVDIFTLGESGAYTLIVEGRIWDTQYSARIDYSFKLLEITDDVVDIVPGVSHGVDRFSADGQLGGALNLNGLRYAEVADSGELDLTGSLTLEAWFKVDAYAGTWQPLFYKGNGNSNQRTYTLWLNSAGYLHLSTGNNANYNINTAAGSVVTGQWHHVAVVLDRDSATGVMKIYLDGVEAASGALSKAAASSNGNPLLIGNSLENYPRMQGAVDEVRLWNSVRSAQQIADNKDHTLVGSESGLLMYLKADETSGTTLADGSGRGNSGLIVHPWASTPGVVAGRIDFGQQDYYRFTLADAARLYFDSLTDNNNIRWTLSGPRGTLVSDRPLQNSDSQNGLSVFDLVAGEYTLRVDGVGDTTGDYGFRLVDLAGAQTLALGTTVNSQLTPANRTDAYQFSANADDRLYFDVTATSGGVPFWRLLDPWGRTVWGPNYMPNDDVQLRTLPFTGVYTLLVEGRRDAGDGSSSYGLRVARVTDQTVAITPGVASGMTPNWLAGEHAGAIDLNGFQYLEVADSSSIDLTGSLTVEAWIKLDQFTNTWQPIFYKGDASSDWTRRTYAMWLNSDGSLHFGSDTRYTNTAAGVVQAGVWTHVAGTIDRATGSLRIYVNGDQLAARDNIGTTPASAYGKPLLLGGGLYQSTDSNLFAGALDEVRIWNTARSQAQIQATRDTPLSGSELGLVLYLRADEGSGETLGDLSGDGNPGQLRALADGIVRGRIEQAGQAVHHSFSLAAPALLYFDSLTNSSDMRWSLSGASGQVVANRSFSQSDSYDGSSFYNLAAGDYTLTVDPQGDTTGLFAFRLLDLADAEVLTPGTAVAGGLNPGRRTDAYRFDVGTADQRWFFDAISRSGADAYWRLLDPWGATVFGPSAVNNPDSNDLETTLPYVGTYTLLIEGRNYWGGSSSSYTVNVQPVNDVASAIALDSDVVGSIANAGQRQAYSFTLNSDQVVYFDSRTNSSAFSWSLSGPRGSVVAGRAFNRSDSADLAGSPVLELVAGDYTLVVDGTGDATGAFDFRLMDLSAARAIAVGADVSGSLQPGSTTQIFSFAASARDRLAFEMISESRNSAYWRLLDPYSGLIFGPRDFADTGAVTMPFSGTYYLLLEGRVSEANAVDFSFRIDDTALPNSGAHSSQDFDATGLPWAPASFSNSAPAVVAGGPSGDFLRLLPGSVTGYNTIGFNNAGVGVVPATVTVDFDFRIGKVSNQGDGIGFAWLNSDAWGNSGPAPQFGEEVNLAGSFGVGFDPVNNGEISDNHVSLHFDGSKYAEFNVSGFRLDSGDFHHARVVVTAVAGGSMVSVYLTANGGSEVAVVEDYFISGMQAYDGRMAFGARNGGWRADNDLDNIRVTVVAGSAEALPVLTLGTVPVSGTLSASGEVDRYRLPLAGDTRVYFDSLTDNGNLRWTLSGPRGTVVAGRSFTASDGYQGLSLIDLAAGDYLLSVFGSTGAYSFKLMDMDQAEVLTPDTDTSGTLSPGNETDIYRFDAAAGERFYFDRVSFSGGYYTDWRLIDPFGRPLWGPTHMYYDDVDLTTLPYSGTYYLLLEGRYHEGTASNYTINARKIDGAASTPITLGDRVDADLGKPGEVDSFSFEIAGSASKRVYFDVLTNTTRLNWTLSGPRGTVVSGRSFGATDAANGRSIMDLAPGSYRLIIDGSGDVTGAYAFRLLDLASATQIVPGTPLVDQTLTPGRATEVYWF